MQNVIRYIIIALIIIVLVIISIGIVKFVPKAMTGLANATVSFGSIFNSDDTPNKDNLPAPAATSTTQKNNTGSNDDFKISDIIPPQKTNSNSGSKTNNRPSSPSYNYPVTGGTPDLVVTILSTGGTYNTNDVVRVNFRVDNRGNGASGPWSLRVNMPSTNPASTEKVFTSLTSLPAGSAITGQAVFDQPAAGTQQISIIADYLGLIAESNEANNTAISNISVNGYNNTNNTGNMQCPAGYYLTTVNGQYQCAYNNTNNNNVSCPNGYYLTYVNGQAQCYPNNNNNQNGNCPFGYYSVLVNGVYQCYPNGNTNTGSGADIQVRVLEFGTIDPYTNQFYSSGNLACSQTFPQSDCTSGAYVRLGQRVAVRFQLYNAGGSATGQFYYRAELGSTASSNRTYGPESSLQPGATNSYTLGLDTVTIGANTLTIYADSQSSVSETNESNNVVRINFQVQPYAQY